jgi:guanylate kinase
MLDAANEISHYHEYDYLIVNDQLALATEQLKSIITGNCEHLSSKASYTELIEKLLH